MVMLLPSAPRIARASGPDRWLTMCVQNILVLDFYLWEIAASGYDAIVRDEFSHLGISINQ